MMMIWFFSSSGLCYGEMACALFDVSRMENTSALSTGSLRRTLDLLGLNTRSTDGIWCAGETRMVTSEHISLVTFDVHALMNVGCRVYWKGTPFVWDHFNSGKRPDAILWPNKNGDNQFWSFEEV